MNKTIMIALAAAASLAASAASAQQTELKSLPGGSLMLKDVPAAQGNLQNLPGVNLNMRAKGAAGANNCVERPVTSLGYGLPRSGTVTECAVGNFSFSTVKPSGGNQAPYWADGLPNPFGGAGGPPPGSGGYAPRPHGIW